MSNNYVQFFNLQFEFLEVDVELSLLLVEPVVWLPLQYNDDCIQSVNDTRQTSFTHTRNILANIYIYQCN